MERRGLIGLIVVVLGINAFFTYVGNYFLPQAESHPPKKIEIKEGISQDELISIGSDIVFSKGQCMVCHPMEEETGMRAPAVSTIGHRMEEEAKQRGITPEEHVFEALVNPMAYIAEGFIPMMPPVHKPPTALSDGELIAVAAFLQSKGGSVTVSYPESLSVLHKEIEKAGGR